MNEPPRQLPCSSKVMTCISAMPIPSASPPWTCPSTIIGLIRTPQSSTATMFKTSQTPVSGSTSTLTIYTANGQVRFGGS